MIELNAATRLAAAGEGVADKAYYEKKFKNGDITIVDGEGMRFIAVQFKKSGRFGIIDTQRPGVGYSTMASGLDRNAAIQGAIKANHAGYFGAFMTMQR
jgi:hypothetical protein